MSRGLRISNSLVLCREPRFLTVLSRVKYDMLPTVLSCPEDYRFSTVLSDVKYGRFLTVLSCVEDYRYEEVAVPVPQPGEVLVKVRCSNSRI
jgi:hypothetical protein